MLFDKEHAQFWKSCITPAAVATQKINHQAVIIIINRLYCMSNTQTFRAFIFGFFRWVETLLHSQIHLAGIWSIHQFKWNQLKCERNENKCTESSENDTQCRRLVAFACSSSALCRSFDFAKMQRRSDVAKGEWKNKSLKLIVSVHRAVHHI